MSPQPTVSPLDEHNRALLEQLYPSDWQNPTPAPRYNLLVVGGGPAGLVAAIGAAGLGAKVALVEKHLLGGDCLNVGCVPSKALIRSARVLHELEQACALDLPMPMIGPEQFHAAMARLRRLRAQISAHDAAQNIADKGVELFLGKGRFTGAHSFEVGGAVINFRKAAVCTGARAAAPRIEGLAEIPHLTNENLFNLTERPDRMVIIGGGPIGCEMSQAFARFGARVTLIEHSDRVLPREDADASEIVCRALTDDGVTIHFNTAVKRVEASDGINRVTVETGGEEGVIDADEILVAAGRAPNVEGLDLEAVGVAYTRRGVTVNDRLQTTNPDIFSAGDVCMRYQFTHAADAAARIVIQNALFLGRKKLSALNIPWCTYTHPEVAHVGISEAEAEKNGIEIETFTTPLSGVDRAICDGETEGFVKIHTPKGKGDILGATIVASHAGEMIGEICVAMAAKLQLGALGGIIHPYPTQAEAIKQTGDARNRARLTPFVAGLFSKWLAWRRWQSVNPALSDCSRR
ncbi:mercuric reductase [Candidatus Sumerlaeota bacterium]